MSNLREIALDALIRDLREQYSILSYWYSSYLDDFFFINFLFNFINSIILFKYTNYFNILLQCEPPSSYNPCSSPRDILWHGYPWGRVVWEHTYR